MEKFIADVFLVISILLGTGVSAKALHNDSILSITVLKIARTHARKLTNT